MAGAECPSHPQTSLLVRALSQEGQESLPPASVDSQDGKDPGGPWPSFLLLEPGATEIQR